MVVCDFLFFFFFNLKKVYLACPGVCSPPTELDADSAMASSGSVLRYLWFLMHANELEPGEMKKPKYKGRTSDIQQHMWLTVMSTGLGFLCQIKETIFLNMLLIQLCQALTLLSGVVHLMLGWTVGPHILLERTCPCHRCSNLILQGHCTDVLKIAVQQLQRGGLKEIRTYINCHFTYRALLLLAAHLHKVLEQHLLSVHVVESGWPRSTV